MRFLFAVAVLVVLTACSTVALAMPIVPAGLNPGDTYQLVYLTEKQVLLDSWPGIGANITFSPPDDGLAWETITQSYTFYYEEIDLAIEWHEPDFGVDAPLYNMRGEPTSIYGSDNHTLYDGSTPAEPGFAWGQRGDWTTYAGIPAIWQWSTIQVVAGDAEPTYDPHEHMNHFIAYSEVLTVPVPEPSSIALLTLSVVLLAWKWRTEKQ